MKLLDKIRIIDRNKISDTRGWFLKIITGEEENLPPFTGEIYLISAFPGECRANHYHIEANEWFTLIHGKAEMLIEEIVSKERIALELNSENPKTIYVPNKVAHSFQNVGDEPYILATYSDKLYKQEDTIPYEF